MPLQAGDMLHGQYQIWRGGSGYVYHARDFHVHGDVDSKELIPGLVRDEAMLCRFLAEAKATMRLSHERIARPHTVFLEDGNDYIVMEYMAGDSLESCLRPFCSPKKGGGHLRESAGRS
jgi:serine/threonine protein kinase